MLNISNRLKQLFESGDDVNVLEHTLFIRDLDTLQVHELSDNIKFIEEDMKVDGNPIGKFPIGVIEFEITGDLTKILNVEGSYEVYGVDRYTFAENDYEDIVSKTYIIAEIEYSRDNRSTFFKGYDYGSKLSVEYDNSPYSLPMTFGQFVTQFYNNHGLQVLNINNLFQKDYQLKVLPSYNTGVSSIQVARDIAKFSLSMQYVDSSNKVRILSAQEMTFDTSLQGDVLIDSKKLEGFTLNGNLYSKTVNVDYGGSYTGSVKVKNISPKELFISFADLGSDVIQPNQTKFIELQGIINKNQIEVSFKSEEIDFIVYNPSLNREATLGSIDNYKSFKSLPDNFKSLGINTLVLGLQADIDGENVSKSDTSMVGVDGSVELRIDDIPFVFNHEYKQEVIDQMFNHIKGFKYRSFESEGKNFYYELGDVVTQVGQDEYGGDYPILILERNVKKEGSMITRHSAESKSVQETLMKWEDFNDKKRTEILVDKANQELKLTVQKVGKNVDDLEHAQEELSQISIKLGEIEQIVSNIDTTSNIIPNINGFNDYKGYSWANSGGLKAVSGLKALKGLRQSTTWLPLPIDSEAITKKSYFTSGEDIMPGAFATGGEEYSYNGLVVTGTQTFDVIFREYDNLNGTLIKETVRTLGGSLGNHFTTITLQPNTKFLVPVIRTSSSVTPANRLELTEQVVNKGQPGEFQFQIAEFVNKTEAKITILEGEVNTAVEAVGIFNGEIVDMKSSITVNANNINHKVSVNGVVSSINQTSEKIKIQANRISLEGLTTINNHFKVLPSGDVEMVNAKVSGQITAVTGNIGNFGISDGMLNVVGTYTQPKYYIADLERCRSIILGEIRPTENDWDRFDVNRDGIINISDMVLIHRAVHGSDPNPITVRRELSLGQKNGEIISKHSLVGSSFGQYQTTIQSGNVRSRAGTFEDIYIMGPEPGGSVVNTYFQLQVMSNEEHWSGQYEVKAIPMYRDTIKGF